MNYLLATLQGIINPVGFSNFFGLPLTTPNHKTNTDNNNGVNSTSKMAILDHERELTKTYISLMGARQLGIGIILATFIYQSKWMEVATILAIIGIVIAGTDGIYLARAGKMSEGRWHALPGALIAALAAAVVANLSTGYHMP